MKIDDFLKLEQAFTNTMGDVIAKWGSVDNVLNNRQAKETMNAITQTMMSLGMDINDALPALVAKEYKDGAENAYIDLTAIVSGGASGLSNDFNRKIHVAAVQELILDTGNDLQAAIRTALISGTDDIKGILDGITNTLGESLISGSPRKVAQKEIMREFARHGLTSFITKDGKRLPLDVYAPMVTRTKRKEANIKGQLNRYEENGIEYVKIQPHSPACGICAGHFGVIVQITGEPTGNIPHIKNTRLPPFHPNCKCSIVAIRSLEGEDIIQVRDPNNSRTESQRRAYAAEQNIRRKANQEKKLYQKMKAEGVEVPATLAAFRRKRRANDESWKEMQSSYSMNINRSSEQYASDNQRDPARKMADMSVIANWRKNQNQGNLKFEYRGEPNRETLLTRTELPVDFKKSFSRGMVEYNIDVNGTVRGYAFPDTLEEMMDLALYKFKYHKREGFADLLDNVLSDKRLKENGLATTLRDIYYDLSKDYRTFDNLFKAGAFEIAMGRDKAEKLGDYVNNIKTRWTSEESEGIRIYTGSSYETINAGLRRNYQEYLDMHSETIDRIDRALAKTVIQEDLLVVRGADGVAIGDNLYRAALADPQSIVGAMITDKGYMSTSISTDGAFGGEIQFQIKIPKGSTNAAYVNRISNHSTEYEVILGRGTRMTVIDAKMHNERHNTLILLCEVEEFGGETGKKR